MINTFGFNNDIQVGQRWRNLNWNNPDLRYRNQSIIEVLDIYDNHIVYRHVQNGLGEPVIRQRYSNASSQNITKELFVQGWEKFND